MALRDNFFKNASNSDLMVIAINVIKRDGRAEPFMPQKIVTCCVKAGVPRELAEKIAEEVSKRIYVNIPTYRIRKLVSKWLRRYDPASARAYESYEIKGEVPPPPKPPALHRHRPKARLQPAYAGKPRFQPSGRKIAKSRLMKKKTGKGRPPTS
jgi:hypothetical protein